MHIRRLIYSLATLPVIIALFAILPQRASALTEYVVTSVTEISVPSNLLSLRDAMTSANTDNDSSVIRLEPGLTYLLSHCGAEPDDTNAAGDLDHFEERDLTIIGDASNILQMCDGENVLQDHSTTGTLRLEGVNLLDGVRGLTASRDTVLVDVAALGNTVGARLDGGPSNSTISVSIKDSDFNLNGLGLALIQTITSLERVGIQLNGEGMRVVTSDITGANIAVRGNDGEGIHLQPAVFFGSTLELIDGDISGNDGIGIRSDGGVSSIELLRTEVKRNGGPGIECWSCGLLDIQVSEIDDNGAAGDVGGGIRILGAGPAFELNIFGTRFGGNRTSGAGGGLLVDIDQEDATGPVTITKSGFYRNQASSNGGAMAIKYASTTVDQGMFQDNQAFGDDAPGGDGGAIHYLGFGSLFISESYFISNEADNGSGGALSVDQTGLGITDTYIGGNRAGGGGGLHGTGSLITVFDSQIVGNRAENGIGGGISVASTSGQQATLRVTNSFVGANIAEFAGGVWMNNTRSRFENATLFLNFGTSNLVFGSGVHSSGNSPVAMLFSTVVANQDPADSPQILAEGSLTLESSVIDGDAPACAVQGNRNSDGYNVVRDVSCPADGADDLVSPSALSLADYADGIPGVLVPNGISPLVGHVPFGACSVAFDARGVSRPQGTDCDTGAAERIGGGVGGPPAALTFGFDQPGTSVDAVVARLKSLGIEVTPADPDNLIGLVGSLRRSRLIVLAPRAEMGLFEGVLKALPAAIVVWDAESFVKFGLTAKQQTTHRPAVLHGAERTDIVYQPTELAVCDPMSADADAEIPVAFASSRRGALCVYRFGDRLANGQIALGPRIGVALAPGLATEAGWELFDMVIKLALTSPEQPQ